MTLQFHQFPYGSDNYGVLVHDDVSGETACVDAGDADAVLGALEATGWSLSELWITHHHADHVDGLLAVKARGGCKVLGPVARGTAIEGVDQHLAEGDSFMFGTHKVDVLQTPGHTLDMINFHLGNDKVVFTGDTLFAMGCGRLFEGSPALMWDGLSKLLKLPDDTTIYCSHEYTLANAAFALSVDPENKALIARAAEVKAMREAGKPTVPTNMAIERATNPFLRADDAGMRAFLGLQNASDVEVFTEVRARKDKF